MLLDTYEIYGTQIYVLFNDKCNNDVRNMLILIRSVQFGFLSEKRLKEMANDQLRQINLSPEEWIELDDKVCGRLENFQKPSKIQVAIDK